MRPASTANMLYILDTGVLYEYLRTQAGFGGAPPTHEAEPLRLRQEAIRRLLQTEEVVIPHIVLVEMIGQFFHQSLPLVAADYAGYQQWHRLRVSAFGPIFSLLLTAGSRVRLGSAAPRMLAVDRAVQVLGPDLIGRLRERYTRIAPRNSREPKFLDGVDAQILDEAVHVARQHSDRPCVLVSSDDHLRYAVEYLRSEEPAVPHRSTPNLYFLRVWDLPRSGRMNQLHPRR